MSSKKEYEDIVWSKEKGNDNCGYCGFPPDCTCDGTCFSATSSNFEDYKDFRIKHLKNTNRSHLIKYV